MTRRTRANPTRCKPLAPGFFGACNRRGPGRGAAEGGRIRETETAGPVEVALPARPRSGWSDAIDPNVWIALLDPVDRLERFGVGIRPLPFDGKPLPVGDVVGALGGVD